MIKFIVRNMETDEDLSPEFDSYDDANCYMAEHAIDRDTPAAAVDTIDDEGIVVEEHETEEIYDESGIVIGNTSIRLPILKL